MTVEAMIVVAMTVTAAADTVTARTVTATVTVDLTEVATITTRNGPTATAAMTGATATRSGQSAAAVITTAVMAARTGGPDMVGTLSHDRILTERRMTTGAATTISREDSRSEVEGITRTPGVISPVPLVPTTTVGTSANPPRNRRSRLTPKQIRRRGVNPGR